MTQTLYLVDIVIGRQLACASTLKVSDRELALYVRRRKPQIFRHERGMGLIANTGLDANIVDAISDARGLGICGQLTVSRVKITWFGQTLCRRRDEFVGTL